MTTRKKQFSESFYPSISRWRRPTKEGAKRPKLADDHEASTTCVLTSVSSYVLRNGRPQVDLNRAQDLLQCTDAYLVGRAISIPVTLVTQDYLESSLTCDSKLFTSPKKRATTIPKHALSRRDRGEIICSVTSSSKEIVVDGVRVAEPADQSTRPATMLHVLNSMCGRYSSSLFSKSFAPPSSSVNTCFCPSPVAARSHCHRT